MTRPRLPGDQRGDTRAFACFDCNGPITIINLLDSVWFAAWPTYKADKLAARQLYPKGSIYKDFNMLHLCLRCVEKRLGRQLTRDDFAACGCDGYYLLEIGARPCKAEHSESPVDISRQSR